MHSAESAKHQAVRKLQKILNTYAAFLFICGFLGVCGARMQIAWMTHLGLMQALRSPASHPRSILFILFSF